MSDQKTSILSHLLELRIRLLRSLIAIAIASIIAFIFYDWIFYILKLPAQGINLVFIEMTEMLGTIMKVCLAAGIILAMPYLVYEGIMFIFPALTPREKRYVYLVLPWIALMFLGGVVFGYFVLIPPATRFLVSFGANIATPEIRVGNYVAVVTRLLLATGIIFELPVITTFLARLGVLKSQWLASRRKAAIIFAFILAAIITPTFDPINQSLVAIPLVVLYEMSIWLARLVQKKRDDTTLSE
ncbi:MAG TPA: twin-arginine translocase subunit TatC [Dehalococcoidia bacterium]|jgi:sec-independent protein translocase protein TatC|nr:twin-arginine translocase subunit TatC [Dehalococcoidia bacterium]